MMDVQDTLQDTQSGNPEQESAKSCRADIRFFSKSANLLIIEQEWSAARIVEFLKIPTRIPSLHY
jgi:hypothetical protein